MNQSVERQILQAESKCQLVAAASGTGKTQLLANIVARRISEQSRQLNTAIVTLTNNAAGELTVRLSRLLSDHGTKCSPDCMFIGSIHSRCQQYPDSQDSVHGHKVIDEHEQSRMIDRIYVMLDLGEVYGGNDRFNSMRKFIIDLELYYNEGMGINDSRIPGKIRRAVGEYSRFMKEEKMIDYGMLIHNNAFGLASKDSVEPAGVYVDECQDVNPPQAKLIKCAIRNRDSPLVAVGDTGQAVYQWRGSYRGRMLGFKNGFLDTKTRCYHVAYAFYESAVHILPADLEVVSSLVVRGES